MEKMIKEVTHDSEIVFDKKSYHGLTALSAKLRSKFPKMDSKQDFVSCVYNNFLSHAFICF